MSGCEETREILVALARGETVSAPGQSFLRDHVETCSQCRRRLANERMLTVGLKAAASVAGVPPESVKDALIAEFRRRQMPVPIRPRRKKEMWVAIAAVAAALVLMFYLAKERRPEKAPAPVSAQMVKQPAAVAKVPIAVEAPVTAPLIAPKAAPRATAPRKAIRRPVTHPANAETEQVEEAPEVATDFFAIPYTEPLRPEERADVFRIQVPRASMAAFGLPVTGGRLDSRISADVLTGEDGVVRAVRFIR